MTEPNPDPYALDCAPGEEAWPGEFGYVCGPADEANPGARPEPSGTFPPLMPPPVEEFPPALPLDPLPPELGTPQVVVPVEPIPRELAETGSADALNILVLAAILFVTGLATWLTRTK